MDLIIPKALHENDLVATISPSWGGAGDLEHAWRFQQGVQRLEESLSLRQKSMPYSLMGTQYLAEHPKKRAEDWMRAMADDDIKAVFCNIGGEDALKILPYIDWDILAAHPKIVMGYSDATVLHMICWKAGLRSYYGPMVLVEFAENVEIDPYTVRWVRRALFSAEEIGLVEPPAYWTSEFLPWYEENRDIRRIMKPHGGYQLLQGHGVAQGQLLGGCLDVLEKLKDTVLFPDDWQDVIWFMETSESQPEPDQVRRWLLDYGRRGILHQLKGILFAKPYDEKYQEAYHQIIQEVLAKNSLTELPVLVDLCFGHTEPMCIFPYGALAQMDCEKKEVSILESGVDSTHSFKTGGK